MLKRLFFILITWCWLCFMVMVLFNALIPVIFKVQAINFIQAAGLLVLGRLLSGGFKFDRFDQNIDKRNEIKESFREKWARHCKPVDTEKKIEQKEEV